MEELSKAFWMLMMFFGGGLLFGAAVAGAILPVYLVVKLFQR